LVCWSIRILSLSSVLDHGNVAIVSVNSVGHSLQTTVRKSDIVFAVGQVSVSVLLGPEVVAGVVVLDGVLPGVHGGHIGVFVDVGFVDWSGSIGGGGSVGWGGLVHDNWLVGDGLVGNRGVSWSNCRGWHIGFSGCGWWWGWGSGGGGGWGRGGCRGGIGRTTIITTVVRSSISILLSIITGSSVVVVAESLDNSCSDGFLEISSSEHSHIVSWVAELEQDWQIVFLRSCQADRQHTGGEMDKIF